MDANIVTVVGSSDSNRVMALMVRERREREREIACDALDFSRSWIHSDNFIIKVPKMECSAFKW